MPGVECREQNGEHGPLGEVSDSESTPAMNGSYRLLAPALFRFDPETVHERAIAVLHRVAESPLLCAAVRDGDAAADPRLEVRLFGRIFPGPLGVAAGFDKNGVAVPALLALGFDFVEVGTVTPLPQAGNPRPRLYRLEQNGALINRMGFPGQGVEAVRRNLEATAGRNGHLGLNIGPNQTSVAAGRADEDCATLIRALHDLAAYVVVNVSSPNTANLRRLQAKAALHGLLSRVLAARPRSHPKPVLVKIAPDLSDQEIDDILEVAVDLNLDGIVATNTTLARPAALTGRDKVQPGGLSGRPLRERSLQMVRRIDRSTGGALPIIAAGGIFTGEDAFATIAAGASLVQTYTGFIYRGPGMAKRVKRELAALLDVRGVPSLDAIRGSDARP